MKDREIDDELRFHLDMRIRDYLARGYPHDEAVRAARARLGDLDSVRQALVAHEVRRERMSRLWQDVRVALRGLIRSPMFSVSTVLILGGGIGIAVAMWSVFSAVLLHPIPVTNPQRIVLPRVLDRAGVDIAPIATEIDRLRPLSRTMRTLAGYSHGGARDFPLMDGDRPVRLAGAWVQGPFFDVLGVRPVLGRLLRADDDTSSHVIVLGYEAWQRYFGGDPHIIGRRFRQPLQGATYSVVGVAPAGIDFPVGAQYWEPLPFYLSVNVVARLAPGATPAMARDEFMSLLEQVNPDWKKTIGRPSVLTFETAVVGNVRPVLVLMVAAVGLLLLIVCINIGSLMLLRAAGRARELGVRRVLGATARDLVQQLVVESGILAVAGGGLGLLIAELTRRALIANAPQQLPRIDLIRGSGAPVGAGALVALLSAMLFGVLPALATVRPQPGSPLRLDTRSGTTTRHRRAVRQMLVGSQVALALVLLAGAALLARSLQRLQSVDLGFRANHLSTFSVVSPPSADFSPDSLFRLYDLIAPRVAAIPGVTGITPTEVEPFIGPNFFLSVWNAEGEPSGETHHPMISYDAVGPDYFHTLGIPVVRGRAFLDSDREHSEPVIIVSQTIARRYWPGQEPLGKRLQNPGDVIKGWRTVVGVVGDNHWRSLREVTPMVYLPFRQSFWQGFITIRSTSSLDAILPAIRRAVHEGDPNADLWQARTVDEYLAKPLAQPRMSALLLSTFGLAALALAAIGLFGLMASAVREQTRDIGVRMALGATPQRVRGEILRRAMIVSLAGAAVGISAALAASRVMASLLFEVSPTDPIALIGACAALLGVASIAAYVPAYRASRVDPARALQSE